MSHFECIKQRIVIVEKAHPAPATEVLGTDARIEGCPAENRVRLFYPGKPDAVTRAKLKGHGFRWTQSLECWQAYRMTGPSPPPAGWPDWKAERSTGRDGFPRISPSPFPTMQLVDLKKEAERLFQEAAARALAAPGEKNKPLHDLRQLCWRHHAAHGFSCMADCFAAVVPHVKVY